MIFNSITFFIFFTLFFILYWGVFNKNQKLQNLLILLGGYVFYAWADWRFLFFLVAVSLLNFLLGIKIAKQGKNRNLLLSIGLIQGIGGLFFFKYYNFFISSFNNVFKIMHINISFQLLSIIIPLGISYFTFRIISYLLDVHKGKIKPTTDWVVFFSYVSFFPSLLSGPIDKAKDFIPQLERKRVFDCEQASDGARQILWGLFKKIVIADNCALVTNQIFNGYQSLPGSTLLLGAFFYTIQVYADFSGYSDMAIGFAKLLGFNIAKNFDFPLFSQNITEFWRKWHISLTSWLTEYVFVPLTIAFRDYNKLGSIMAVLINFIVVGIWHGANWTYILFGFLNGCFFIPQILRGPQKQKKKVTNKIKAIISFKKVIKTIMTFMLLMVLFVIFRMETVSDAFHFYNILFSRSLFASPIIANTTNVLITSLFVSLMLLLELFGRKREYALQADILKGPVVRIGIYYFIIFIIIIFSTTSNNQFIYFQF